MKCARASSLLLFSVLAAICGCLTIEQPGPAVKKLDSYVHHRVQYEEENLRAVAAWYTGSPENARFLMNHNPGVRPNRLRVGQTILIPAWLATTYNQLPRDFLAEYQPGVIIPRVSPTPTATSAPTRTPVPEPTVTRTPAPSRTPFPTRTPRPTRTPVEAASPRPTRMPVSTRTPRPVPPATTRIDPNSERHTTTVRTIRVTPSSRPVEEWRREEIVPDPRPSPPPRRPTTGTIIRLGATPRPSATPAQPRREPAVPTATLAPEELERKKLLDNLLEEIE